MLFPHISEHRFIDACHAGKRLPFLVLAAELLQRYRPVRFQNIFPDSRFTPKGKFRSRKGLLHDSIRPDAFRFRFFRYHFTLLGYFAMAHMIFLMCGQPQMQSTVYHFHDLDKLFKLLAAKAVQPAHQLKAVPRIILVPEILHFKHTGLAFVINIARSLRILIKRVQEVLFHLEVHRQVIAEYGNALFRHFQYIILSYHCRFSLSSSCENPPMFEVCTEWYALPDSVRPPTACTYTVHAAWSS